MLFSLLGNLLIGDHFEDSSGLSGFRVQEKKTKTKNSQVNRIPLGLFGVLKCWKELPGQAGEMNSSTNVQLIISVILFPSNSICFICFIGKLSMCGNRGKKKKKENRSIYCQILNNRAFN